MKVLLSHYQRCSWHCTPRSCSSPAQWGVHIIYLIGVTGSDIMVRYMIDLMFSAALNLMHYGLWQSSLLGSRVKILKLLLQGDLFVGEVSLEKEPRPGKIQPWARKTDSLVACVNHCKIPFWKLPSWCMIKWTKTCFFSYLSYISTCSSDLSPANCDPLCRSPFGTIFGVCLLPAKDQASL